MAQAIAVGLVQLTDAQFVTMMLALAVKSPTPKLTPLMVTVIPPDMPPLKLITNETAGESKLNRTVEVPLVRNTKTPDLRYPPAPEVGTHCTVVPDVQEVVRHDELPRLEDGVLV